jgi:hypothetical protein
MKNSDYNDSLATKKCKVCNSNINSEEVLCANCGFNNSTDKSYICNLLIFIGIFPLILFISDVYANGLLDIIQKFNSFVLMLPIGVVLKIYWNKGEKIEVLNLKNKIKRIDKNIQSSIQLLSENEELVIMAKKFIESLPSYFYTNRRFLINFNSELEFMAMGIGIRLTLVTKEEKEFLYLDQNFLDNNKTELDIFSDKRFKFYVFLSNFINVNEELDQNKQIQFKLLITSMFIIKIVSKHFAEKFEQENVKYNAAYFENIGEFSLDEAITGYCMIDSIIPNDEFSIGCLIYFLIKHNKFDNDNFFKCYEILMPKLESFLSYKEYDTFINKLKTPASAKKYSIEDVDLMSGLDFEQFIAELFRKKGYRADVTKASGDQGIDVVVSKNGESIGIQAKCYTGSVGNSAIQEVVAGKIHYKLDKALVITNSNFTDSARQLAKSNAVILWDRNILKQTIDEVF